MTFPKIDYGSFPTFLMSIGISLIVLWFFFVFYLYNHFKEIMNNGWIIAGMILILVMNICVFFMGFWRYGKDDLTKRRFFEILEEKEILNIQIKRCILEKMKE